MLEADPTYARTAHFAPFVIAPDVGRVGGKAIVGDKPQNVIIEINSDYRGGRTRARRRIEALLRAVPGSERRRLTGTRSYVFASLTLDQVEKLVAMDRKQDSKAGMRPTAPAIFKVWNDRPIKPALDRSVPTVKADACIRTFGGEGRGIVWAVVDSGIDSKHAHFATYDTLNPEGLERTFAPPEGEVGCGLRHINFTDDAAGSPLVDEIGHGTHVAGIIAGETPATAAGAKARRLVGRAETTSTTIYDEALPSPLKGVAPRCQLLSLKVMSDNAGGPHFESAVLAALDYVARANDDGRRIRVHGVNLSLSLDVDPRYYAVGQSPVCVAVDRLVNMGVVVVVAAGNAGSGFVSVPGAAQGEVRVGLGQSITDPANAELAITVGSTHAEAPHTFGVSYFSSRGPTADGRDKPDLVAPGERIVSCASQDWLKAPPAEEVIVFAEPFQPSPGVIYYRDLTGTSMAAPHVAGAAALLLSTRREFIGNPREIKARLMKNATSLGRRPEYQGAGLLDVFRTLQDL